MKYLVVVADDFGFSEGVNKGCLEAMERGVLTEMSFMVNSPGSASAVKSVQDKKLTGHVGIHITLNNLNKTGQYLRSRDYETMLALEPKSKLANMVRDEFKLFEDLFQQPPTHLNSHKNVHQHPKLRQVFAEYALQHDIFVRRTEKFADPNVVAEQSEDAANKFFWKQGVKLTDHIFEQIIGTYEQASAGFISKLKTVAEGKTVEILLHPAYVDDTLASFSSMTTERERDRQLLMEETFRKQIVAMGYELTTFTGLKETVG